jgi:hypothetical protein
MKKKEFVRLEQQLLPEMPGFAISGPLMFIQPVGQILRGICFESSGFSAPVFYVSMFVLPLCIPREYLSLNFGDRIKRPAGRQWRSDSPDLLVELSAAIRQEALPTLRRVQSLSDFLKDTKLQGSHDNPNNREAVAYALIRTGDFAEADRILRHLLYTLDVNVAWERVIAERANGMRAKLAADPSAAQRQLEVWEAQSIQNLGLTEFA